MRFDIDDLNKYIERHALSPEAADFMRLAEKSLSRDVGRSGYASHVTEHQSTKTMVTVHTESESGELAYAYTLDFDDNVITYYEQLPPIDCIRTDKNGRRSLRAYRADFLILRKSGPEIVEIKNYKEVKRNLLKYPDTWIEQNGEVIDLGASNAFAALGLKHRVIQSIELSKVRVSNIKALIRARDFVMQDEDYWKALALQVIADKSVVLVSDLISELKSKDNTVVLKLVLENKLFVDLDRQLLTMPHSCWVSDCLLLLEKVIFDQGLHLDRGEADKISILAVPTRKAALRSLARIDVLETDPTSRNAGRLRATIGANPDASPFQALIPKFHKSGNRLPKRPEIVLQGLENSLRKHLATPRRLRPKNAYAFYKSEAKELHPNLQPVSKPTYLAKSNQMRIEIADGRGGKRMANAAANPSDVEDRSILATRPFERASVDSCLLKIYCILLETERDIYVCRPNLIALRDLFTQELLARWITFSPPSRRTTAILMRVCGRRYGRIPECISADGGKDTDNVYFSSLCAHLTCDFNRRPSQNSRYGGQIERFFSEFNTEWLDHRPGNRTDVKNLRHISTSHHPANLPCMPLPLFFEEADEYIDWRNTQRLGDHKSSPSLLRKEGLEMFPFSGIPISFDDEFIIATAVDHKSLAVDPSRGIKHGNEHYWHRELRGLDPRRNVEIRIEPEDHTRIYARVADHWVTCRSGRSNVFQTLSPLQGLCESILVLEGDVIRKELKDQSDMALVKIAKEADRRFAMLNGFDAENVREDDAVCQEQQSLWDLVRTEASLGVAVTNWEGIA